MLCYVIAYLLNTPTHPHTSPPPLNQASYVVEDGGGLAAKGGAVDEGGPDRVGVEPPVARRLSSCDCARLFGGEFIQCSECDICSGHSLSLDLQRLT